MTSSPRAPPRALNRSEAVPSALTTQELMRVLEALCWEPGEEINICISFFLFFSFFFLFFFFLVFRAAPMAYGGSQARGRITARAWGIQVVSATYTTAHGHA